jgi:hypothetical protein
MMTPSVSTAQSRFNLGTTIPALLALTMACGLALQAIPLDWFAFRAYETLRNPDRNGGPFVPHRIYRNARTYGDLASVGNLARLRQYRPETFSTDHWGYRNLDSSLDRPTAILIGDSYGVGVGMSDSETLSASLGRIWGHPVYNASGDYRLKTGDQIAAISRRLGMTHGLVIYEFLERLSLPTAGTPAKVGRTARKSPTPEDLGDVLPRRAREIWSACRLRIVAERAYRRVQDDHILPNPYRSSVARRQLVNGREILFVPAEVETDGLRRTPRVDYWVQLRDELRESGLELAVLLVPNKYTVYGALLRPPAPSGGSAADYLSRLELQLRAQGIEAVNLERAFRVHAREALDEGSYIYWLDDSHWNGRGIDIAAEELARAVPMPSSLFSR